MMNRKLMAGIALVVGVSLGFGISSLRAAGVPQENTLFYSGTVTEGGVPVTGNRNISLSLWTDEMSSDADTYQKCAVAADNTPVEGGRFRVELSPACVTAVHDNPDLWVRVQIGDAVLPRAKVGAVPYALEAANASNAVGALDQRISALESRLGPESAFLARVPAPPAPRQTVPTATATKVDFGTPVFDLNTEFHADTDEFIPKTAGYYYVQCDIEFYPATIQSAYGVGLNINGMSVNWDEIYGGGSGGDLHRSASIVTWINAGQKVTCTCWQNSGENRSIYNDYPRHTFQAFRIPMSTAP